MAQELLPGTLYMMVLQTLAAGPLHGYAIARRIRDASRGGLQVEDGSLYPALNRMLVKGWLKAEWGTSDNNRRARFYRLTPEGRKQLEQEASDFDQLLERHAARQHAGVQSVSAADLGQRRPAAADLAGVGDRGSQPLQAAVGVHDRALLLGIGVGGEDHVGVLAQPVGQHRGVGHHQRRADGAGVVSGTVAYRERMAMPENAVLTMQLQDVSNSDAPPKVIAEQRFTFAGQQVPLPFELHYEAAKIDPAHTYALTAKIAVAGQVMFLNSTTYDVITHGNPTKVDMSVQMVEGQTDGVKQ